MQVTVGNEKGTGTGPNKKLAKRAAAENVLLAMGYAKPAPQPAKPAIKSEGTAADKGKKVRREEGREGGAQNRTIADDMEDRVRAEHFAWSARPGESHPPPRRPETDWTSERPDMRH